MVSSLDEIVEGPPVKKLIFLADAQRIEEVVKPMWQGAVKGRGAAVMQAVPTMLEVVPEGVNKWVGMKGLLQEMALPPEAVMAVGDGGNDFELVQGAGLGVAMGNAVQEVGCTVGGGHKFGFGRNLMWFHIGLHAMCAKLNL